MLKIVDTAESAMLTHLEEVFPNEGCGFFFGTSRGEERTVLETRSVSNVKDGDQRRRFEINPLDYIRAEAYALESGLELLGVYHSHPNHPAIPSEHDRKQAVENFSYIIVSVMDGKAVKTSSWRLNSSAAFEEETIIQNQVKSLS